MLLFCRVMEEMKWTELQVSVSTTIGWFQGSIFPVSTAMSRHMTSGCAGQTHRPISRTERYTHWSICLQPLPAIQNGKIMSSILGQWAAGPDAIFCSATWKRRTRYAWFVRFSSRLPNMMERFQERLPRNVGTIWNMIWKVRRRKHKNS